MRTETSLIGNHRHHDRHPQHELPHGHSHGVVDSVITSTERGLWAIKWSFIGLAITATLQLIVVFISGSVALLVDTIHNFGDAATAIPLAVAFWFARKKPSERFTFGYGWVEDLAGVAIVLTILAGGIVAGYQSIDRLLHPQEVSHLWWVVGASIMGFLGNEAVAIFRIRVGREIKSAALIADGYHARIDGWTSLAVLVGAVGVWLGYPLADPIVGLLITAAIFGIVIQSSKSIFTRVIDDVDPHVIEEIRHAAEHVSQVRSVTEVRARWLGHRLHSELNIAVTKKAYLSQSFLSKAAQNRKLLLPHQKLAPHRCATRPVMFRRGLIRYVLSFAKEHPKKTPAGDFQPGSGPDVERNGGALKTSGLRD